MAKTITRDEIRAAANTLGVETAVLLAMMDVECRGSGFNADGTPVILFERHIFWRLLGEIRWFTKRRQLMLTHPQICNPKPGGYGRSSSQHAKLDMAARLHRDCALQSASWGLGQVMGFHWQKLGYPSLQAFVNDMYASEAKQLHAMVRYIQVFGLADKLQHKNWASFAHGYNGPAYRKNRYDEKLAMAYRKHSK